MNDNDIFNDIPDEILSTVLEQQNFITPTRAPRTLDSMLNIETRCVNDKNLTLYSDIYSHDGRQRWECNPTNCVENVGEKLTNDKNYKVERLQ